jgi:hypothetical protein
MRGRKRSMKRRRRWRRGAPLSREWRAVENGAKGKDKEVVVHIGKELRDTDGCMHE